MYMLVTREANETAYEALVRAHDAGTALWVPLATWGCPGCRPAIAMSKLRVELHHDLRKMRHDVVVGSTERDKVLTMVLRCTRCSLSIKGHLISIHSGRQNIITALELDEFVGAGVCRGRVHDGC